MQLETIKTNSDPTQTVASRRGARRQVRVEGRLTWKDAAGTLRFASVVTRDVSEVDAFVECHVPTSIPRHRLVHFQVERTARSAAELPESLRQGKVLSAVYRIGPYQARTGTPQGYALRLLVEPGSVSTVDARATLSRSAVARAH